MKRVIIESPFSSGTTPRIVAVEDRTVRYLRACLRHSLLLGEAPFASHGLYTQEGVLDDHAPEERERGMRAGWAWVEKAALSAAYTDLGWSHGMQLGVRHALVEARQLGGAWVSCAVAVLCVKMSKDGAHGSNGHAYWCPLWRAPDLNEQKEGSP